MLAALAALLAAGCAGPTLVIPVHLEPGSVVRPGAPPAPREYAGAIRAVAALLTAETGLPLPRDFTVFVYPSRAEYERGLVREGRLTPARAAAIAGYSLGLGQARRLFLNDEALRGVSRALWLGTIAHELTHLAQYELSGGRRSTSEQWLREGMADWVAARVLEAFAEDTLARLRTRALSAVGRAVRPFGGDRLDLVDLGRARGWEARHLRAGSGLTYQVAFLLADELIRRHGLGALQAYFRRFADSPDRFDHFQRSFGVTLEEFEAEAAGWLVREAARHRSESLPPADASLERMPAGGEWED